MSENICLATNYLLMTEPARQTWTELDQHLEEFGSRLVLLTSATAEPPLPFPTISIPFLLRDYARLFSGAWAQGGKLSRREAELLCADSSRAHGAYGPEQALPGLLTCRRVMEALLETLQPGYVLTWDSTSPQAVILRALCAETSIPVQSLERGLLPETLMVESRGIQGHSDLRTHWLAQEMSASAFDPAAYERIRSYYVQNRPQKYQQPAFGSGAEDLRQTLGLGRKKIVVFFGNYDPCGLTPADSIERRYHSPAFASTNELLMDLWSFLQKKPDVELIFKPHPIDGDPYAVARIEGVRIVKDVNVHALIELADVVVAQFTTLQFEAALYDKPVVLAGRSAWWGRNAAYEVQERAELKTVVESALARSGWAERARNARAFLTWSMEQFLIGCSPAVPARRNLRDLARFIARTSLAEPGLPPKEERWDQAQAALERLRQPTRTNPRRISTQVKMFNN
jgi:hypothetical protein